MNGGLFVPQRGQQGSVFSFQCLRLNEVGRASVPALRRNDNCPAGRPCMILFHTWFLSSSSATSRILFWTVSYFSLCHIFRSSFL